MTRKSFLSDDLAIELSSHRVIESSDRRPSILRASFLEDFSCLGAQCEDTCCKGWGMQVDDATRKRYAEQAPELLEALGSGEAEHILRRDPATDHCVKFEEGLCGIQRQYGTDFLGDACHFYPRITRGLGERRVMTAALSCPEIVRLALMGEAPLGYIPGQTDRLPHSLKDYLPPALQGDGALTVHQAFLEAAGDETSSPERILARFGSVARSLEHLAHDSWPGAIEFYLRNADARLPAPISAPADPFHLVQALGGLIAASNKTHRPRLDDTFQAIVDALDILWNEETRQLILSGESEARYASLLVAWEQQHAENHVLLLHRWIQMQIAMNLFPFSGFGGTLTERITVIGVRFATLKLALLCSHGIHGGTLPQDVVVRIIQSLSRFLDHLADPSLSLQIYRETGWTREARMRGLLGDGVQSQERREMALSEAM